VLLAFVIAVGATCGDLVMSFIKRDLQLKDFGKVLPGHGGLLDRLDSVIFVAPLFFHLVNLFYPLV
jgi:phosphatidate cytidylyltransferase